MKTANTKWGISGARLCAVVFAAAISTAATTGAEFLAIASIDDSDAKDKN